MVTDFTFSTHTRRFAMTTKDWIYLGLLAVCALVFYCHGFFSGVARTRKLFESLFGSTGKENEEIPPPVPPQHERHHRGDRNEAPPYWQN